MTKYLKEVNDKNNNTERRDWDDRDRQPQPRGPVVNMISGGPTTDGTSKFKEGIHPRGIASS